MTSKKKYKCDYCNVILRHYSPSVQKTHLGGKRHKDSVRIYYQTFFDQLAKKMFPKVKKQGMILPNVSLPPNFMQGMMPPNMLPPMNPAAFGGNIAPNALPPMMMPGMIPPHLLPNMLPPPGMLNQDQQSLGMLPQLPDPSALNNDNNNSGNNGHGVGGGMMNGQMNGQFHQSQQNLSLPAPNQRLDASQHNINSFQQQHQNNNDSISGVNNPAVNFDPMSMPPNMLPPQNNNNNEVGNVYSQFSMPPPSNFNSQSANMSFSMPRAP